MLEEANAWSSHLFHVLRKKKLLQHKEKKKQKTPKPKPDLSPEHVLITVFV